MYAVIFEVEFNEGCMEEYLKLGAEMRERVVQYDGFISAERFSSVVKEGKVCSLSFWESEDAIKSWKQDLQHLLCQKKGQESLFSDYRIRIAKVERDYSLN
ncbi:antibiotic biosynthesis monooxygenase family protein [Endozoicomonas arenosclerae]|uniref:antibiotic biosynthesis monooxygenase family protein n=1 Tax=Endozoicomonas arenosclerae TaxID=1633495 RepID=UPI000781F461|nr:antibiotic biosynthesis monooxygenase [Endozoicomonas arenosclerae]